MDCLVAHVLWTLFLQILVVNLFAKKPIYSLVADALKSIANSFRQPSGLIQLLTGQE